MQLARRLSGPPVLTPTSHSTPESVVPAPLDGDSAAFVISTHVGTIVAFFASTTGGGDAVSAALAGNTSADTLIAFFVRNKGIGFPNNIRL